jgi:enterochelin esterase-like enzyme
VFASRINLALWLILIPTFVQAADPPTVVSDAKKDDQGILVHEVTSAFQSGMTKIRVLLPDKIDDGKAYPVIYVLPVEARDANRYGNGLLEVKKQNLQNRAAAIFVAPTFSQLPWYADHPTNPLVRQETYFLQVVLPFVESHYPVKKDAAGRLLVGFSKSGWGAFSLLLRHPDVFGKAAAWDAPLMMAHPDNYGMAEIFVTQQNFEDYHIARLLEAQAPTLRNSKRLILLGYGGFRVPTQQTHDLMVKLNIPHDYRDGPQRSHDWMSGWLPEAVEMLTTTNSP